MSDVALVESARRGDEQAFRELTDPYRRELQVHCYRMLGSVQDAEDVLQETLLAAWRGLASFEQRSSLRSWLYRIATNRCLNAARDSRRRPAQLLPFDVPEPTRHGEVTWLQPYSDTLLEPGPEQRYQTRESVELAFITGLQQLPPRQAAVLVLRDVLGYTTSDVAAMLDTSPVAVKAALQRARETLATRRRGANDPRPPAAGSAEELDLTRRFADAFTAGDVDGVVALLTDDAWLKMPPAPFEYQGKSAIGEFLRIVPAIRDHHEVQLVATRANTQPAFACYAVGRGEPQARATGMLVLTLSGANIIAITHFLPDVFRHFGLPETPPDTKTADASSASQ